MKMKLITIIFRGQFINEDELQVGNVVSALWLPNGQYYDAKVLQKGGKQRFSLFKR